MDSNGHFSRSNPRDIPEGASAAFFDMDRTVLRIDSGMSWMRFLRRRGEVTRAGMARAVYWSALYRLAVLDMETLVDRLAADFEGVSEVEMLEKCRVWYRAHVAHEVTDAAVRTIRGHRDRGDLIVLLTGSSQFAAEVVARSLGIEHTLCSRVEVARGLFTGRMTQYGFGVHKVALAEQFARQRGIDLAASTFYSDSFNDMPMLSRVGRAVAVNPDARLRRHARRAGWRVEIWR